MTVQPSLKKFSRGANDAPPRHLGTRYNRQGIFLPEPGNTVVSHLTPDTASTLAILEVRRRMTGMPEAGQFAFTHPGSLHMTVFQGIIEYRRHLPFWPSDMALDTPIDDMTAAYRKRLLDFVPPPAFKVRPVEVTPLGLMVEGETGEDRRILVEWRDRLAGVFGYRHPDHEAYVFHITFAYVIDWLTDDVLERWSGFLAEQLAFLKAASPVIALNRPAFCSFQDMHHFEELLVLDGSTLRREEAYG